jgi:hypothetical protein
MDFNIVQIINKDLDFGTIGTFFNCMMSEKGQEPARKYMEAESILGEIKKK